MKSQWDLRSLREAGVSLIDCDHRTPPAATNGYPYVAIPQLKQGRIDLSDVRRISAEHFREWTHKAKPQENDVILSRRCNPGETAHVPAGLECALGQNLVLLRSDGTKVFPPFLRWLLRSPQWWNQVNTFINVGAVFDSLKCADIPNFKLPLPPLADQKAIAAVLGALDDKIELNRQMNATLEAMARALFQSWFVDFDPVRAKLDGRQPTGLDSATAALFPNEFHDSELGPIPKGWSVTTVGAKLSPLLGGTPSRAKLEYWTNGTMAWINSGKTNEFRIIEPSEWITEAALENSATKLLPRRTTVLAITGATLGQVSVTEIDCCANQSVVAVPASDAFPTEFIYLWIEENIRELLASQTGGAQQHVNKGNVEELSLLYPEPKVMNAYLRKAKPLFDQIATNCFQSSTLGALRDTLLPKLLAGDICAESQ
jgi:type I restriction enzyme S subunit